MQPNANRMKKCSLIMEKYKGILIPYSPANMLYISQVNILYLFLLIIYPQQSQLIILGFSLRNFLSGWI